MKRFLRPALSLALVVALGLSLRADKTTEEKKVKDAGNIGHMVYFQLKDGTPENRAKLVAACRKYLTDHEGTVYFSAGVLADDLKREVNVRDWDVALHLVFKDKAAHDKYQDHERHTRFVEENKDTWKTVRVFDAVVR